MTARAARQFLLFCAIAASVAALFWWRRASAPSVAAPVRGSPVVSTQPEGPKTVASPDRPADPTPAATLEGESAVAEALNAPENSIQRDLAILDEVFAMWLTNFPREGNPVGENAEITAALTGDNIHRFAFIPRRHRAINVRGELCDRWGTPFRFHQLSGRQMEIRSAGPDRKFGTADDAALTPP